MVAPIATLSAIPIAKNPAMIPISKTKSLSGSFMATMGHQPRVPTLDTEVGFAVTDRTKLVQNLVRSYGSVIFLKTEVNSA